MPGLPPFDRVVREHGPVVLRVCRAVLGTSGEADDAWQETFLAALRAYPDLDPTTNLQAWLVTVAHRKAVDVLRRERRRAVPTDAVGDGPGSPASDEPGAAAEASAVRDAVAALPERQRWAVTLHHLGGLSWAEVALVVGGTEAAARRAGADGVAALRRTGGWR